jgi:hypothetical protein
MDILSEQNLEQILPDDRSNLYTNDRYYDKYPRCARAVPPAISTIKKTMVMKSAIFMDFR